MKKIIRRSISSLTLRAFWRTKSNGNIGERNGTWFFQKRQESTLTQSDPSVDDGFDVAAFFVEGQLDFPNQVPGNVLQLYRELYDMNQKVKQLENEIAVYVMTVQNKSHPLIGRRGVMPFRRKPNNINRNCCIPGFWNCARPGSVISNMHQRNRTIPNERNTAKRPSVSRAVQTPNLENRGSRLSKVSWNSKVDVRYIGSGVQRGKDQKVPLQETERQPKADEDFKNVVHLKIKIPKDVLSPRNDDGGRQPSKRLVNEWETYKNYLQNDDAEGMNITARNKVDTSESMAREKLGNQDRAHTYPIKNQAESSRPLKSSIGTVDIDQMSEEASRQHNNTIVGTSIVRRESEDHKLVGIPVKKPGKPVCDSPGCTCRGSKRNDNNLEKVRQSFDMTESELSLLEEAVHNTSPGPMELKIQTEYGSVNVVSHDPDCKCKICETFGSHGKLEHKQSGRSDSAAVISKKIIRVHYNGHYRNIITHTEECGCDICSNIEEHSYKLMRKRASIVSTHQGELVVKNKGVCGCKNCKTVEIGPHVVDVETLLSKTSSHVLDQCYYSDATIPSLQSFPRECLSTTDDQGASFSSPPSINSSDLSDDARYGQSPASHVNPIGLIDNVYTSGVQHRDAEPARDTSKGKCSKCENIGYSRGLKSHRNRLLNFVKPSSAKSSPAGLYNNNNDNKSDHSASCKNPKGNSRKDKGKPIAIISRAPSNEKPLERAPVIDNGETIQSKNSTVSPTVDKKAEKDTSRFNADKITLEDLIRDLIHGQPGIQRDKVYSVTLGEIANRAYTKIHIVNCLGKSEEENITKTITGGMAKNSISLPKEDGSNSSVYFIKTLPSSTEEAQMQNSALPDSDDNSPNIYNRSLSSPVCIQGGSEQQQFSHLAPPRETETLPNNRPEGEVKVSRSASDTSPRADASRKAFKLTISFGKKLASFFKQRAKKSTMSNHLLLPQKEVSQLDPNRLKTFTIYGGAEHLKHMELVQIDMKPRYFTLETNGNGEEASPFKDGPILCLVEKNSNAQVLATIAT